MTQGAVTPMPMSPHPVGKANIPGRTPLAYRARKPNPAARHPWIAVRSRRSAPSDDGFDIAEYFVKHPSNHALAKIVVYTHGQTPEETRDEILERVEP